MNIMAKTIMVSNEVYDKLKEIKEREDKSFSEVIMETLNKENIKIGRNLRDCFGLLKNDKEYDKVFKETEKYWGKWNKKYA